MEYSQSNYDRLISRLFDRHPSVQDKGFTSGSYKPGLDAMLAIDRALGCPSRRFRSVHVAGTNGKGSVSSMLASALDAAGFRVGLYTSPHLVDFRERIRIIGKGEIPREDVWRFLTGNAALLEGLSFFEVTTAMAFSWFAQQEADIAVIEAGLGGRLDSTNIITPELSIVTSIGLDHCALLGSTREAIATEKAGIFKPGVPALAGEYDPLTAPVFERAAAEKHCPLFFARDFDEPDFRLDLEGPYQAMNLHTALAALELLGIEPDFGALARTAERSGLRGRWEKVLDHPETICDIGHNPPALEINFARLKALNRPLFIVYGIMADKDIDGIRPLMPVGAHYFLVAPRGERALPADRLAAKMQGLDCKVCGSVRDGIIAALDAAKHTPDSILYIGGSNFVVAEALPYLDSLPRAQA